MTVIHYSGTMSGIMDGLLEGGGFTIKVQDGVVAAMPKEGGYGICGIKGGKMPCLAHARDERGPQTSFAGKPGRRASMLAGEWQGGSSPLGMGERNPQVRPLHRKGKRSYGQHPDQVGRVCADGP